MQTGSFQGIVGEIMVSTERFKFSSWSSSVYGHAFHAYCQGFLPCLGEKKQAPALVKGTQLHRDNRCRKKQLLPLDRMHAFFGLDPGRASYDLSAYRSKHSMLVCHRMKCIHELRPACGDTAVGDGSSPESPAVDGCGRRN